MRDNLFRFSVVFLTIGFIAITIGFWNWTTNVSGQNRVLLFTLNETPKAKPDTEKNSPASVRESEISINTESFSAQNLETVNLPLFDNRTYQAIQNKSEGFEVRSLDNFTWRGKIIEKEFNGDVVLTFNKGYLTGLIYSPKAVYEIIAKGDKQILVELDQSLFPECVGGIKGVEEKNSAKENIGTVSDSGDRIDVLVVYTTATKNILGGDVQAQTHAQQAIDATNTAYFNSKIRQRVRLVHTQEYLYTETTSASTDLANLRGNAEIQALRDTHKADLVAMLGEISGACGVGYLMGSNTTSGNPNSGYTVTARSCAVGNLSFAHELGHNMGSQHNPENGSNPTYPFGFGHYVNGNYRTVMSYSDPCGSGCTRRPYFSTPEVIFSNAVTGIDNQRDNARSINLTADVISNYRYSGTSLKMNNYNGGDSIPRNLSKTVNWSSDNLSGNVKIELSRNDGTNWETLVSNTANDGSEVINIYGRPTKRARIRISSISNPNISDSSLKNVFIK